MIDFRIIESPDPIRTGTRKERRVIADVTDIFESSVTMYASTRVLHGERAQEVVEENKLSLVYPKRWRVNMASPLDRAGIQQFKSVPFDFITEYWRKPVNIKEGNLETVGSHIFRFNNKSFFKSRIISCFLLWSEINMSPANPTMGVTDQDSDKTLEWMFEHSPVIIPFTDQDTIFMDPETEVAYISDLMG